MEVIHTTKLADEHRKAIFTLWNTEYPEQLQYKDLNGLNAYISNLPGAKHFLYLENGSILGWAFKFPRESETWFAVILNSSIHKKGIGTLLLDKLKEDESALNGWVVDHDQYFRTNGEAYQSPLNFYLKNHFSIDRTLRLESSQLSAAKIRWQASPIR
ncbi:GNAT family protein [Pedobacter hartonius]|uniref:N-acetyltransferase domain-containing protein n=1 Tax=Pedobacter hartonius TaxID=425514 RepID=A0A1H4HBJ2_9SPHI|nr:GNAT family N-acetyltransferase [Pedobacter hartonius]SEB19011.1 hypothetical protein SAMN05443550_11518 [Pedobacter hartonius]